MAGFFILLTPRGVYSLTAAVAVIDDKIHVTLNPTRNQPVRFVWANHQTVGDAISDISDEAGRLVPVYFSDTGKAISHFIPVVILVAWAQSVVVPHAISLAGHGSPGYLTMLGLTFIRLSTIFNFHF